jgi:hypothetical protein
MTETADGSAPSPVPGDDSLARPRATADDSGDWSATRDRLRTVLREV